MSRIHFSCLFVCAVFFFFSTSSTSYSNYKTILNSRSALPIILYAFLYDSVRRARQSVLITTTIKIIINTNSQLINTLRGVVVVGDDHYRRNTKSKRNAAKH